MGMVVRSNIMAMNANRQLGVNNSSVSKNLEKLSSGFKINRAGDDASGLAISEKMKAQIKGLETASSNAQDGISLVQTAEGALTEVHDMLNRMVELATKSANGTIQDEVDREAIQSEVDALNDEIDRISQSTNFNGINLLDGTMGSGGGSGGSSGIKVGSKIGAAPGIVPTFNDAVGAIDQTTTATAANGANILSGGTIKVTYKDDKGMATTVEANLDDIAANAAAGDVNKAIINALNDAGLDKVFKVEDNGGKLKFTALKDGVSLASVEAGGGLETTCLPPAAGALDAGAHQNATKANTTLNLGAADILVAGDTINVNGQIYEFVAAAGDTTKTKGAIGVVVGTALGAADDATSITNLNDALRKQGVTATLNGNNIVFEKKDGSTVTVGDGLTLQIGDTGDEFNMVTVQVDDMSAKGLGTNGLDVSNADAARKSIATIKAGINKVSTNRADLGALQNRLEHTINNLDVAAENMSAANSRIRDTDMAKQMMEYTKMNVLTQAAQAMLAQANQQPQSILQLLQ